MARGISGKEPHQKLHAPRSGGTYLNIYSLPLISLSWCFWLSSTFASLQQIQYLGLPPPFSAELFNLRATPLKMASLRTLTLTNRCMQQPLTHPFAIPWNWPLIPFSSEATHQEPPRVDWGWPWHHRRGSQGPDCKRGQAWWLQPHWYLRSYHQEDSQEPQGSSCRWTLRSLHWRGSRQGYGYVKTDVVQC